MMRRVILAVLVAVVGLAAQSAHAFPVGTQFDIDPVEGDGAGGVAFTGAPRWAGHTCDVCHTDPPHRIGASLLADPVDLFASGYVPASIYKLRVTLNGEWAGLLWASAGDNCGPETIPYEPCDDNGFAIELDDASGTPTGTLAPVADDGTCDGSTASEPDVYVLDDGTAAMHSGFHHAVTEWNLCWTAPAQGTGPVIAFVTVVDGNGGDDTVDNPNDFYGDDVFAGAVPLAESGAAPRPPDLGSCAIAVGARTAGAAGLLFALAVAVVVLRRRRGVALVVGLALTCAFLGGCATTNPWQKEKLAKRKMKFGADPAEDELDLHMQDAREVSQGGYGSEGGGCGCN